MPTYPFVCTECGNKTDYIRKISEMDQPAELPCESCGKIALKRDWGVASHLEFMSPEALGRKKAPSDFRNWLSAVKRANKGCHVKDH